MPHTDPSNWSHVIPFLGLITNPGAATPIIMRLVEACIIGAVIMFGTVQAIGTDIDWIKAELHEVKQDIKELRRGMK